MKKAIVAAIMSITLLIGGCVAEEPQQVECVIVHESDGK